MQILQIKENKNGSADIDYQLSKAEVKLFKNIAKQQEKKYTDKFVNGVMLKAIKSMINNSNKEWGIVKKEKDLLYTWIDFDMDLKIVMDIVAKTKPKTIVGIAFGALPLLTCIKNRYPHCKYEIIFAESYQNKKQNELKIEHFKSFKWETPILLIDEIVDTGKTMKTVVEELEAWKKKPTTLSLFIKDKTKFIPNFYLHSIKSNVWAKMPWEG